MKSTEFDIIRKYFSFSHNRPDVLLAGGDDCAMVSVPDGKELLITTDTLIAGMHFPSTTSPEDIAYKAVMVNLSDLAAMGATPAWLTLAISLPEVDESWLSAFSQQLESVLRDYHISLIGGDTTRGELSITIQAMGLCERDRVLRRDRAVVGDSIFVTGHPGDAAVGLRVLQQSLHDEALAACVQRLNRPQARIRFAQQLSAFCRCAIDISDGLAADLGHVLIASRCGARVDLEKIPLSASSRHYFERYQKNVIDWSMVLTQGDDYELCFTAASQCVPEIFQLAQKHDLNVSVIGEICEGDALELYDADQQRLQLPTTGFQHF